MVVSPRSIVSVNTIEDDQLTIPFVITDEEEYVLHEQYANR